MMIELRQKSQITLPSEIIKSLGLKIGDQFEVVVKDGIIHLIPVVVYPKEYIEYLENIVEETKKSNPKKFTDFESMIKELKGE